MCIFDIKQSHTGDICFVEPSEHFGANQHAWDIAYQINHTEVRRLNLNGPYVCCFGGYENALIWYKQLS